MIAAKKIIPVIFVALVLAGSACANMTSVPPAGIASVPSSSTPDWTSSQPNDAFGLCVDWSDAARLDSLPPVSLSEAAVGEVREAKPVQVLADRQSSLSLCLYVLTGIGLCKTVPSVRKLSLGCIPDWYHDGGPFQVGHSHAITPDLCLPSLICFIQPAIATGDLTPNYGRGTIASFVWGSLFIPDLRACRGPPLPFC